MLPEVKEKFCPKPPAPYNGLWVNRTTGKLCSYVCKASKLPYDKHSIIVVYKIKDSTYYADEKTFLKEFVKIKE